MKISFVVSVFNVEKYIKFFLESIEKQNIDFTKHLEIILVDDGSTDSSSDICKKWERKYPNNIKYIYKENGGLSSARNLGIEKASCEWISFPDPEGFLANNYLFEVIKAISTSNKKVDFIQTQLMICNDRKKLDEARSLFEHNIVEGVINNKTVLYSLGSIANFFKTELIKTHNLSYKNYPSEDCLFFLSFLVKNININFCSIPTKYFYLKRKNKSLLSDKIDTLQDIINRITLINECYLPIIDKIKSQEYLNIKEFIERVIIRDLFFRIIRPIKNRYQNTDHEKKELLLDAIKKLIVSLDTKIELLIPDFELEDILFIRALSEQDNQKFVNILEYNYDNETMIVELISSKNETLSFFLGDQEVTCYNLEKNNKLIFQDVLYSQKSIYCLNISKNTFCLKGFEEFSINSSNNDHYNLKINNYDYKYLTLFMIKKIFNNKERSCFIKIKSINAKHIKTSYKFYILFSVSKYKDDEIYKKKYNLFGIFPILTKKIRIFE